MSNSSQDWIEVYKEMVQPRVSAPLVSVGFLHPAGAVGNIGVGRLSPILGLMRSRKSNKATGGLAKVTLGGTQGACLALTKDELFGFAFAPGTRGRTGTIGDQLGEWPRCDVHVTTNAGRLTTKVVLNVGATGEHYELECMTTAGNAGTSELFLEELTAVAS